MIFSVIPVYEALGCYLAHSQRTKQGRIAKGTLIDEQRVKQLLESGITDILAAQLETNDLHENAAASLVAAAVAGPGVRLSKARTGRVNLHATTTGLCNFDRDAIITANAINEGITIATVPENLWVPTGRMIATVKIIPYAVTTSLAEQASRVLENNVISVHAPTPHRAQLIQTTLSSMKATILDKTHAITRQRLEQRGVTLTEEHRCAHAVEPLVQQIQRALGQNDDWILIVGASAISDRNDVIPSAIVAAGGRIERYGIPVDPGNLLLLGHIDTTQIIGLPGCARSIRYNGLDQILDRLVCNLSITDDWISSLAIGGLLTEIADRPAPRVTTAQRTQVGAILLAAGSSKRAGNTNKLLFDVDGTPMVSHIATVLGKSRITQTVAVTGFDRERVELALSSHKVECCYNASHNAGMASSLICGVSKLLNSDAIIVCLGDMPHLSTSIINQLIDAFTNHPDKSIFIPTHSGNRGNPVLFSNVFFDTLLTLEGDVGAKFLCSQYPDKVFELAVEDSKSILMDYDTEKELSTLSLQE